MPNCTNTFLKADGCQMFLAGVATSRLGVVNTGRTIGVALAAFHLHVLCFVVPIFQCFSIPYMHWDILCTHSRWRRSYAQVVSPRWQLFVALQQFVIDVLCALRYRDGSSAKNYISDLQIVFVNCYQPHCYVIAI